MEKQKRVSLPIDATVKGSQAEKAVVNADKADMVIIESDGESVSDRKGKKGETIWARKMSMDKFRDEREEIERYIEKFRAKGIADLEEYKGVLKKMEVVESALDERRD